MARAARPNRARPAADPSTAPRSPVSPARALARVVRERLRPAILSALADNPALSFNELKHMGFIPGLKAFTAAVLGGIGSVPGAFLGSMILGVLESLGPKLFLDPLGITNPSQLKDANASLILVFILIFRPSGILGERLTQTKV